MLCRLGHNNRLEIQMATRGGHICKSNPYHWDLNSSPELNKESCSALGRPLRYAQEHRSSHVYKTAFISISLESFKSDHCGVCVNKTIETIISHSRRNENILLWTSRKILILSRHESCLQKELWRTWAILLVIAHSIFHKLCQTKPGICEIIVIHTSDRHLSKLQPLLLPQVVNSIGIIII